MTMNGPPNNEEVAPQGTPFRGVPATRVGMARDCVTAGKLLILLGFPSRV